MTRINFPFKCMYSTQQGFVELRSDVFSRKEEIFTTEWAVFSTGLIAVQNTTITGKLIENTYVTKEGPCEALANCWRTEI